MNNVMDITEMQDLKISEKQAVGATIVTGILIRGNQFPFRLEMPCGHVWLWDAIEKPFPNHDIPCTCGDPKHWFVRFTI